MGVCSRIARRSGKDTGQAAGILLMCLIPPVIGNGIIILSRNETLSLIGCYSYYLGMDLVMAALLHFTFVYCRTKWPSQRSRNLVYGALTVDVIQLALNPIFHHAFDIKATAVDGRLYYQMIPHLGQTFHRVVDYALLAGIMIIFIIRLVKAPRLQTERYSVILITMIVVTVWETSYIFSGTPVDRSMIGFGVFGLMVFYFSVYHRPMRLLDRMLGSVVSEQPEAMFFFDAAEKCLWMNPAGQAFLGLTEAETEEAGNALERKFGSRHKGEDQWSDPVVMTENGETKYYELSKRPLIDTKRKMNGFYISVRDDTKERLALEQKLYQARHDRLTGIYTRDYLHEKTRELLAAEPKTSYLIIYVDISDFKLLNDLYGHDYGDLALRQTAEWISGDLSERAACGRLGGDTFGVCVPEEEFRQEEVEQKLARFAISDGTTEREILIHVGIYRACDREMEVSVMYDRAHLAQMSIKDDYHTVIAWYEDELREKVMRNRQISSELKGALEDGQIRPWFQPIVNREGKTIGAEALVRWVHPEEGIRPPAEFIPVLEKNGMISEVDRLIWRKSCEVLKRWQAEEKDLFLSVNISPEDFRLMDVAGELKHLAQEYGIDPGKLRLEITETVMMDETEKRRGILQELRDSGFSVEMDDFGSGYSSLNMLKDMPVDVLKIDMVFLRQSREAGRARTIVRQIIALAKELGITSLTEGVETEDQYGKLREMGCELYQGYYFARPMPLEELESFCKAA